MIETLLIALGFTIILGTSNVMCFYIGAKVGQKVVNQEKIKLPTIPTPTEQIRKHQEKKEQDYELDRINTVMKNIDIYDGTGFGQKEVPKARERD